MNGWAMAAGVAVLSFQIKRELAGAACQISEAALLDLRRLPEVVRLEG
jgi:hypothetical protein